jgi:hypothetical protein
MGIQHHPDASDNVCQNHAYLPQSVSIVSNPRMYTYACVLVSFRFVLKRLWKRNHVRCSRPAKSSIASLGKPQRSGLNIFPIVAIIVICYPPALSDFSNWEGNIKPVKS